MGIGLLDFITSQPSTGPSPRPAQNSVMQNPAIWDAIGRMGATMMQAGGQGANFAQGMGAGVTSFKDAMDLAKLRSEQEKRSALEAEIMKAKLSLSQREMTLLEKEHERKMNTVDPRSDIGKLRLDVEAGLVPKSVLDAKINEDLQKGGGVSPELLTSMGQSIDQMQSALDAVPSKGLFGIKDPQLGPYLGRVADMANVPEIENLQGAQNTVALQARNLLKLPASGFSDADREFLEQVVGGKHQTREGYQKAIDRIRSMLNDEVKRQGRAPQAKSPRDFVNKYGLE